MTIASYVRFKLLNAVIKMHNNGVQHGDLDYRHITLLELEENRSKPYIVGFTGATADHRCKFSKTAKDLWRQPEPTEKEVGCPEIFTACQLLGVFSPSESLDAVIPHFKLTKALTPGDFLCFGRSHSVWLIEDVNLEQVAKYAPEYMDRAEAIKEAYKAMLAHATKWFPSRLPREIEGACS